MSNKDDDQSDPVVEWQTRPRELQRQTVARTLRRIARRISPHVNVNPDVDYDFYRNHPEIAKRDIRGLQAVALFIRQCAEGRERI